ncbi:hypothetical protein H4R21_006018 [Coemansia helicoidea]|nr:hypothetical protein H4R21_006018 [Coemansia helicoidea]
MNDVGRALDERQVSVAQLDAYCTREIAAAQQPPAATAIDQLRRQASRVAGAPPADSASAVFFDARAEELLCKLVGLHTSSADRAQDTGDPDTGGVSGNGRHDSDEDSDFEAPDVDSADTPDAAAARQPEGAPAAEDPERAQPPPPATPPSAAKAMLLPSPSLPDYIPTHCPLFPSPHTYRQTPVFPKREQDFFRTRMHKAEQSRQAEENLQRLISGPHAEWAAPADDASSPSPRDPADGPGAHAKHHHAHKRIRHLFPPPNFRTVRKRTRLTDSI